MIVGRQARQPAFPDAGGIIAPHAKFTMTSPGFTPDEIFAAKLAPIMLRAVLKYDTAFPDLADRVSDVSIAMRFTGAHSRDDIVAGKIDYRLFDAKPGGPTDAMT